jgi:hypothetical protein
LRFIDNHPCDDELSKKRIALAVYSAIDNILKRYEGVFP